MEQVAYLKNVQGTAAMRALLPRQRVSTSYMGHKTGDLAVYLHHFINFLCVGLIVQWNLSRTTTCGSVLTDVYGEVAALQKVDCNASVLFVSREAGCFSKAAAQHSDHLRQIPLNC